MKLEGKSCTDLRPVEVNINQAPAVTDGNRHDINTAEIFPDNLGHTPCTHMRKTLYYSVSTYQLPLHFGSFFYVFCI
jgi:hypothetical protein